MKFTKWIILLFLVISSGSAFAANGDFLSFNNDHRTISYKMLDAQSVTASSPWVDLRGLALKSVDCDAIETGGKVEIMVKNDTAQPASGTDGSIAFTLQPLIPLTGTDGMPHRWYKLKKTQGGTPAPTTCILEAR